MKSLNYSSAVSEFLHNTILTGMVLDTSRKLDNDIGIFVNIYIHIYIYIFIIC